MCEEAWILRFEEAVANGEASPPNPCADYRCADYDEENDKCLSDGGCGDVEINPCYACERYWRETTSDNAACGLCQNYDFYLPMEAGSC